MGGEKDEKRVQTGRELRLKTLRRQAARVGTSYGCKAVPKPGYGNDCAANGAWVAQPNGTITSVMDGTDPQRQIFASKTGRDSFSFGRFLGSESFLRLFALWRILLPKTKGRQREIGQRNPESQP